MKVVNTQIPRKHRVLLLAVAMSVSAGGVAATTTTPTLPPGAVLVKEFYDDATLTRVVGAEIFGSCPQGPTPVPWGKATKFVASRLYTCPSSVQRIPKP